MLAVEHLVIGDDLTRMSSHPAHRGGDTGGHAAFDFPIGTLILTEAGTKKRASLHAVRGEDALAEFLRDNKTNKQEKKPERSKDQ